MKKKSKLTIKHYYREEVGKLIKGKEGFPLYVVVTYKRVRTVFKSRFAVLYTNSKLGNEQQLRESTEIAELIIKEDVEFIEQVFYYFEKMMNLEFKGGILINNSFFQLCNQNSLSFFNSKISEYDIESVLSSYVSIKDAMELSSLGSMKVLRIFEKVNIDIYNDLIKKRGYFSNVFQAFKTLLINENEINYLKFRLLEVEKESEFYDLKIEFDEMFDRLVIFEYERL